jgi:hypothetical protein
MEELPRSIWRMRTPRTRTGRDFFFGIGGASAAVPLVASGFVIFHGV